MKVLLCTDGSEQSKAILGEASRVVQEHNPDEVIIIHVDQSVPSPYYGEDISKTRLEKLKKNHDQKDAEIMNILKEAADLLEANDIKIKTVIERGIPSDIITRIALEDNIDMIVVCSRGRGGLKNIVRKIRNVSSKQKKTDETLVPALFLRRPQ